MKSITSKLCAALTTLCVVLLLTDVAEAQKIGLNVAVDKPVMLAGKKQSAFLKVSLTGFSLPQNAERTPVNVAIVLDKSGSMRKEKIQRAREAATLAISRLNADDIVSVIAYDDVVRIIVPATKVRDKQAIFAAIDSIEAGGSTALFAGVSKGAQEVRKFLDRNRVNRVILLSDGLANVGPSSPTELGRLGASLGKEGISVTTIGLGLGYNEDLMTQLAGLSDGNHAFVENANDLTRIFNAEFGDVLSVVAQQVEVQIRCAPGIRPIQVLGRNADIAGQTVFTSLNQLYGEQEKFILLEVEVPAGEVGQRQQLATVDVTYLNMQTRFQDRLSAATAVSFTPSPETVAEATDDKVVTVTVEQVANKISKDAVKLRDEGRVEEAQRKLEEGAEFVKRNADQYQSAPLRSLGQELEQDADALGNRQDWNRARKELKKKQYSRDVQQSY
ncbi:MAG: VWA domain-containing protein [Candidatus Competibacteraceae bacterium]|jgi:Ca-activated chloride channel family protein|nr:VWA domain-containing protein [Candidatus Competibacteraceae bacterium]